MNVSRRVLLSVAGWVLIVAVGATMVWTVVAHAGRDVGETTGDTVAASASSEPTSSADPTGPVTAEPGGGASPPTTLTAEATPSSASEDGSAPVQPSSEQPSSDPSPTPSATEDDEPPPSTPPPPQSHRKTWQGTAGTVVASCTGAKISLVAAQPNSGWRVEVGDRGPEELSVKFELTEGEDDDRSTARSATGELRDEVEVRGHCSGGVPTFAADG